MILQIPPVEPMSQGSDGGALICLGPVILLFVALLFKKIAESLDDEDKKEGPQ